ncbi:MAG: aldo/keto reductase [Solirubrobacteraceae bacterium]|nr:aldo/keto reductase [Solirubrobacteraceae bacterium]
MVDLGHVALGAWGGGRYLHYGRTLDDDEFTALMRPDERLSTLITADVYGSGQGDLDIGRALAASDLPRDRVRLVGAVGHDFYTGERKGAKGFPRFTDPTLRGPDGYADYLRMATERSLERCGTDRFDLLLLHNPDLVGYTSEVVWDGMVALRDAGLTRSIGIAPGPANGFVLDLLTCLERFGDVIDWAMVILGPMEPWPAGLVLPACEHHDVKVLTRVTDYGGIFWDDLRPDTPLPDHDHRRYRPDGWIERGRGIVDRIADIGRPHGLSPMQTAAQWTLSQPAVACVAPTIIAEMPGGAVPVRPVADKRAELAAVTTHVRLTPQELERITAMGDNTGSMALKGASPVYDGDVVADQWPIGDVHTEIARRWGIDPHQQLVKTR